jgi:leucyl-tRNA synthetase
MAKETQAGPVNHFDAAAIEQKWQQYWEEHNTYTTPDSVEGKENFYALSEFSYPSGNLHVGHWYAFAVPDIFARYKRMQGYNVLYPTGFDAFGLPAENAAIKRGVDPKVWTWEHMDHMRKQLRTMGASFDWNREAVTADPAYYKWTQWMFNQFFKNGIVYRGTTKVNWDPVDKTVLANEQVINGRAERSGAEVVQKNMNQWMLKITDFADDLVDDLDDLDWDHSIKQAQREWIGRKEGSLIPFKINDSRIEVFTTRADTLFGVSYVVLAPEHEMVQELKDSIENFDEVEAYLKEVEKKSDLDRQQSTEKTGVKLKGITAVNPANSEEVPVWIADYVLAHFGTGAVMAVPAHDERDSEFALKYNLPFKFVVLPSAGEPGASRPLELSGEIASIAAASATEEKGQKAINAQWNKMYDILTEVGDNILPEGKRFCCSFEGKLINSPGFNTQTSQEARESITQSVGGKLTKTYRLRDWGISRQRYWGCPIPIVYDPDGNAHPVADEHLPWTLPSDVDHTPDGTAPLSRSEEFKKRTEDIFGEGWTPEVDTMDAFVDSTWYFYRYLDNKNDEEFASEEKLNKWMPVDQYFGGAEHTTMHLLYSRFWTKALHKLGLVKESEPYIKRLNRGLILGPDGSKMSKSKGNVIDPDEVVSHVGADTVRTYLAFIGPFNEPGNYPWDPNGVVGVRRFLDRVYRLREKLSDAESSKTLKQELAKTIKKVQEDNERFKFNTAISAMMVLVNVAEKEERIERADYEDFLKLVAPFAPHLAEELWFDLGNTESIHLSSWPSYDESLLASSTQSIAVQVNGKVRAQVELAADTSQEDAQKIVMDHPDIQKWVDGKEIKKFIYVPGKIVNVVV